MRKLKDGETTVVSHHKHPQRAQKHPTGGLSNLMPKARKNLPSKLTNLPSLRDVGGLQTPD